MKTDLLEILKIDSSRLIADMATKVVGKDKTLFQQLLLLMRAEDAPINWRAARVVELVTNKHPSLFSPFANPIAKEFSTYKTDGLKRSLAKVFRKHLAQLTEENTARLIGTCFAYLTSGKEPVAVEVNCMQLLFDFTKLHPEIAPELRATIELLLQEKSNSAAFCGRAKQILRKLA